MKQFIFIFYFLCAAISLHAQDNLPAFGKIDKADLEMKDCDFDPGAEAMVLMHTGETRFSSGGSGNRISETNYRIRIKVFKKSAVDRGQVKMRYYSKDGNELISDISGISYNLDESGQAEESKLESRNVYDKPINKDYSEVAFALPNVKPGTVFEFRYKITRRSFSYIPAWNFQQEIPIKYSAYSLELPAYYQFKVLVTKRQEMEKKVAGGDEGGTWYIMRNIKGLKNEPYSSGRIDYVQRIEFQLSTIDAPGLYKEFRTTWPKLIEELKEHERFGLALKKNLPGIRDIVVSAKGMQQTSEKIRTIYNYVQANMQWNKKYALYSDDGIKEAWDKKNGNITDINFILLNILKEAGVDAKPLLISTKEHGVVPPLYPFLSRFNAVFCYVKDGDTAYIMNAADKYNPYNLVPYDVINTNALVIDKTTEGLILLRNTDKFDNGIFISCVVESDGKISGNSTLESSGYARSLRMITYKRNKLKDMLEDNDGITIKADSISVINEQDELLPLQQDIQFSGSLQTGGDYFFLPYNLFTGIGKNPFIEESRVMDIDFLYPKSHTISGAYYLPDNLVINELPRNTKLIMPDSSIILTRKVQQDGNIISFRVTIDSRNADYAAEEYPYLKDFFKKMYAILDERIVLKKK